MDLYSLVLEHEGKSFATQVHASSADQAVAVFISDTYPGLRVQAFGPGAPDLGGGDIIYVAPMTGLVGIWSASVGRDGRYVSVVCVRTVSGRRGLTIHSSRPPLRGGGLTQALGSNWGLRCPDKESFLVESQSQD